MWHALLALAFHEYALAALVYLAYLVWPWKPFPAIGRVLVGSGLVLHGIALAAQGVPQGLIQGLSALSFLLLLLQLALDLRYRMPVIGAFLTPIVVAVLVPSVLLHGSAPTLPNSVRRPLLPLHISIALLGMAAFAVATGVAVMYLLLDRQMKGKRFGMLFSRLPSLGFLDELNRRLVVWGFIALSVTLITGAYFASGIHGAVWVWQSKEIATLVAWALFAGLLTARVFAGWQGRRVAMLTMAGFCLLLVSFFSHYPLPYDVGLR